MRSQYVIPWPGVVLICGVAALIAHRVVVRENLAEDHEDPPQPQLQQGEGEEEDGSSYLTSSWNNYQLYTYKWMPDDPPKAMMFISHGVTEHIGRYHKLVELLSKNGIIIYGHDHVGHGHSYGLRCHVEDFQTYVRDVIQHLEKMRREHQQLPIILMGHSMGGLIAAHVAMARGDLLQGLILSAPPLIVQSPYSFISTSQLKYVVNLFAHWMPKTKILPLDNAWISTMEDEQKGYGEDPLVYHGKLRFGWTSALINATEEAEQRIKEIPNIPLLMLHGMEDTLVPIAASEFTYEALRHTHENLLFKRYEGCRHEVLHDKDQETARQDIKNWILDTLLPTDEPQ